MSSGTGATGSGGASFGCVVTERKFATIPDALEGYRGSPLALATAVSGTWKNSSGDTLGISIQRPDGGTVGGTYHESSGIAPPNNGAGQPCSAATYFGIGVQVTLRTTDGRFADEFDGELRLNVYGALAILTASIPVADIKGTYHPTDAPNASVSFNGNAEGGWFLNGEVVGVSTPGSSTGSSATGGGIVVGFAPFDTKTSPSGLP